MADRLYTEETVLARFYMWDTQISETKPEYRPHDAWYLPADISTITLTVTKPNALETVKTLAGGSVVYSGKAGEWEATFDTDGGSGRYWIDWRGTTTDGFAAVSVSKVTARARP